MVFMWGAVLGVPDPHHVTVGNAWNITLPSHVTVLYQPMTANIVTRVGFVNFHLFYLFISKF